jgi:hypothetical protein
MASPQRVKALPVTDGCMGEEVYDGDEDGDGSEHANPNKVLNEEVVDDFHDGDSELVPPTPDPELPPRIDYPLPFDLQPNDNDIYRFTL